MGAIERAVELAGIIRKYSPDTTLWSVSIGGEQSRTLLIQSRVADPGVTLEGEMAVMQDPEFGAYLSKLTGNTPYAENLRGSMGRLIVDHDGSFVNHTKVPRVAVLTTFAATPEAIGALSSAQQLIARHGASSWAALISVDGAGPDYLSTAALYADTRAFATGVAALRDDPEFAAATSPLTKLGRVVAFELLF